MANYTEKAMALSKDPKNAEVSASQISCGLSLEEIFRDFQKLWKLLEHIWLKPCMHWPPTPRVVIHYMGKE